MFTAHGLNGALEEVATLVHPEARQPDQALKSDSPGHARKGTAHGLREVGAARDHEADLFAAEVARYLTGEVNGRRLAHLVLCASPRMLGRLRAALPDGVKQRVRAEYDKDLTGIEDPAELRGHLPKPLFTGTVLD